MCDIESRLLKENRCGGRRRGSAHLSRASAHPRNESCASAAALGKKQKNYIYDLGSSPFYFLSITEGDTNYTKKSFVRIFFFIYFWPCLS